MSRTFTIDKTPETKTESNFDVLKQLDVPKTAMFTELLSDPDPQIRNDVLFSFEGSLNWSLMSYARMVIAKRRIRNEDDETPSIDARNEAEDAEGKNSGCYSQGDLEQASAEYAGNRVAMPADQIVKHLAVLRRFVHMKQEEAHRNPLVPFTPRPMSETVDYIIKTQLAPVTADTIKIANAAKELNIPAKIMADIQNAQSHNDRERLMLMRDEIIELIDSACSGMAPDEQMVEEALDSLPAHIQYAQYAAVLNGYANAFLSATRRYLGGRGTQALDALGAIPLIRNMHTRGMETLRRFAQRHADELMDYGARGGKLRDVRPLPGTE